VKRARLVLMAGFFVVLPVASGACGDDSKARDTLPPIVSTTTTTTIFQTTTTYPEFYIIQSGDTLGSIALMFGTTEDVLATLNNLPNKNDIQAGQKIKLPPAPAPTTPTTPTTVVDPLASGG
jgi:LysM repeat protein